MTDEIASAGWKNRSLWVVVTIMVALAIPRLLVNYGTDGDAVRSAKVATELLETGLYVPSRLPGNPLFEYVLSAVVPWGGHVAANLLILLSSIVAIWLFLLLVDGRKNGTLTMIVCGLTPVILVNAATTMDYMPGLAMLLGAYVCVRRGWLFVAAVLLGAAIGLRLSNALFVLPLAIFMCLKRERIGESLLSLLAGISLGAAFYIPVFQLMGLDMFDIPPSGWSGWDYLFRTGYKGLMSLGPIATLAMILVLAFRRITVLTHIRESWRSRSPSFYLETSVIVLFGLLFLRHSDETEYLIVVIPFIYLLLTRWFTAGQWYLIGILIVSYAFVSLELKGGESGRRTLTFRPAAGIVINDYVNRVEMERLRDGLGDFHGPEKAVILTGHGSILTYENDALLPASYTEISPDLQPDGILEVSNIHRIVGRDVFLVYALSLKNVSLLRSEGYVLFVFSENAPSIALNIYGYDPFGQGMKRLEILSENAFYR